VPIAADPFLATLALVGAVIVIAALLSGLIERSGVPQVAVLLALGAVLGPYGLGLVDARLESPILRAVATLSLALVMFTDALSVDPKEIRRHRSLSGRVEERDRRLQALQSIERDHADQAEQQHADRIAGPMLLLRFIDAADCIGQPFDRPQHRRQQGALPGEDAGHIAAERLGDRNDDCAEDRDLNPPVEGHERLLRG